MMIGISLRNVVRMMYMQIFTSFQDITFYQYVFGMMTVISHRNIVQNNVYADIHKFPRYKLLDRFRPVVGLFSSYLYVCIKVLTAYIYEHKSPGISIKSVRRPHVELSTYI